MEKKTVLVVEDDGPTQKLISVLLKQTGYEIIEATTAPEALEKARLAMPNLILMDLGLPGITGDEAIACLKADPATKDIPVVVSTAYDPGSVYVERAITAGAAEILYTPGSFRTLPEVVSRYLTDGDPRP
jgi:two-component system, cell cycle response regulator DivK